MAQPQVTMKVTPHELQIIRESLRVYVDVMGKVIRGEKVSLGIQLDLFDGDPRKCAVVADKLLRDIGMK